MAGNFRRRPVSGDPFEPSAERERFLLDAADQVQQWRRKDRPPAASERWAGAVVLVRNVTGADVGPHQPLSVTTPTVLPGADLDAFRRHVLLDGDAPAADTPLCITLAPIRDDEVGPAVIAGVVQVQVTGTGDYALIDGGVLTATDDATSCEILYRAAGTGTQWALVRLGAAGACKCPPTWVVSAHGRITGGTWAFALRLGGTLEQIEVDHNCTAAALATAIEGHSKYGDVGTPTMTSTAYGPLLQREIHIRWSDELEPPLVNSSLLDGDDGCSVRIGVFGDAGSGGSAAFDAGGLLQALKTVDGSGSGLDADLVDGTAPSAVGLSLLGAAGPAAAQSVLSVDDLVTLSGVADGAANLGAFTGSTIADNQTIKAALQTQEAAVEAVGDFDGIVLDTDGALAGNSDAAVPSQKAVKSYVDGAVTGLLDFKGATDAAGSPNFPAAAKGDSYVVSTAGKVGGAAGRSVDVGDVYLAIADNAGGTEASVGAHWIVLEHNLQGAILAANNLGDIADAAAARTNLGISGLAGAFTAASAGGPASLDFHEDTDNGTHRARVSAPASLAADVTLTLPGTAGTLVHDGAATLSSLSSVGTIGTGVWQGTPVGVAYGGTGQTSCAIGDIFYGAAANTTAKAGGATSVLPQFLRSVGNGTSNTGTGFALVPGQLLAVSRVATDEATSSTTPADLTTVQSVTFTLPAAATVWIRASAVFYSATVSVRHQIAIDVDGTDSEIAFSDCAAANHCATVAGAIAVALGSGSHTLKLQFSVNTGTGRFLRRCLDVAVAP